MVLALKVQGTQLPPGYEEEGWLPAQRHVGLRPHLVPRGEAVISCTRMGCAGKPGGHRVVRGLQAGWGGRTFCSFPPLRAHKTSWCGSVCGASLGRGTDTLQGRWGSLFV